MSCQFPPQLPLLSRSYAAITQTCQKLDDFRGKSFFNLVQIFLNVTCLNLSNISGLYHCVCVVLYVTSIISGITRKISEIDNEQNSS